MKFFIFLLFYLTTFCGPVSADLNLAEGFVNIAEKAIPAVVTIWAEAELAEEGDYQSPFDKKEAVASQGSGVLVSDNGVILTNHHVITGATKILVILNDGSEYPAKVLGADPQTDLAVIKIEEENTPYLPLGDSSKLRVGEWVVAAGTPLGLKATITKGIVSATGRSNLDIVNLEDFIQTDAGINRGNSGGPLLNVNGEVIGINTAIASNKSGAYMGIGFAIPSNMAKEVLDQVMATGRVTRGFLGVDLQPMTQELALAFGLEKPQGAILADVTEGSAAEKAGLLRGDIIMSINGKPVESTAALRTQVAMMSPGSEIQLGIKRGDTLFTLPVILGSRLDQQAAEETPASTRLGIVVEALSPETAKSLGHGNEQGVLVTKVDPKGAVSRVGIKRGALILSVNQKKVTTPEEFLAAVEASDEKSGILLQVKQDGAIRYIYLRGV